MQRRKLGGDGPEISVVGVGAWAIGGPGRPGGGAQDEAEAIAALHRAFDSGVTWVDTAAVDGAGHAEKVVGQVLREHGGEALVFAGCGRGSPAGEAAAPRPAAIRAALEASLRRLGTDHVDLYRLDWPDAAAPVEDAWAALAALVAAGTARWAGVATADVALLERCEAVRHVDAVQAPLSLLDQDARRELLPWCAANGTGVLGCSPLRSGLLGGTLDATRVAALPADDRRRRDAAFRPPALAANLTAAGRLEPVAARHGVGVAAVAVAWVLAQDGVTAAAVGARRPSQVDGVLPAGSLRLSDRDLAELDAAPG